MQTFRIQQGAVLVAGSTLISTGGAMLVARDLFGLVLIGVGAALVYWREMRKEA